MSAEQTAKTCAKKISSVGTLIVGLLMSVVGIVHIIDGLHRSSMTLHSWTGAGGLVLLGGSFIMLFLEKNLHDRIPITRMMSFGKMVSFLLFVVFATVFLLSDSKP